MEPNAVDEFWFAGPNGDQRGQSRKVWFVKDCAFDEEIRCRFLAVYEAAAENKLAHWATTPRGALSLIVVLDQFPRNLYRDTPGAFSTDLKARTLAKQAVDVGLDQAVLPVERLFFYLPFEHSESIADQVRAVTLFEALTASNANMDGFLDYARRHHAVVEKFGRFPHRNHILNRESTAEEIEFLKQTGSSF
ncbi:MAG: DUF924 family protein [Burkholderiales bacterium]